MKYGQEPAKEQVIEDDEEKLLRITEDKKETQKVGDFGENGDMGPQVADWRFGPAQIWYDILKVPETGEGFTYGFKIGDKNPANEGTMDNFDDDAFLMVSQLHWEDEVIWNGDDIKHKVR